MTFKREFIRKSFHLFGLVFLFFARDYKALSLFILFSLILIYFASLLLERAMGHGLPGISHLTHFLKRGEVIDFAPPFLATGILLTLFFFKFEIATCAILQICVGDVFACLVGKKWGKRKIFYSSHKTYLGSFVFFVTVFLIQLPFVPPTTSLLLAAVGTIIESLPLKAADNLTVPLGVALFFQWIQ